MARSLAPIMAILAVTACAEHTPHQFDPIAPSERAVLIVEGHDIAVSQCSRCHAVGRHDVSPRSDAPPLREAIQHYDSAALTANMMIGVRVGHPDMPLFHMGPRGADALVEYINSLKEREPGSEIP